MTQENKKPYSRKQTFKERRVSDQAIESWLQAEQRQGGNTHQDRKLKDWMRGDPQRVEAVRELEEFLASPELDAALHEVNSRENSAPPVRNPSRRRKWQWAAAAVLLIALPSAFFLGGPSLSKATFSTAVGEQRQNTLADGSRVLLNTDSALEVAFAPGVRKVRLLRGEALFEVTSNPSRPFVVEMPQKQITVVGTRFIAHVHDGQEDVQVLEGEVRVQSRDESELQPVFLHANEMLVAAPSPKTSSQVKPVTTPAAWLSGRLVFESTPLPTAIDEMNRYFPGTIVIASERLKSRKITATYHLNDLDAALEVLAKTLECDIQHLGFLTVFY